MHCPECGHTVFEIERCPACEALLEIGRDVNVHPASYGGFWVRLAAFTIDNIIIFFATSFLSFIAGLAAGLGGLTSGVPSDKVEHLAAFFGFFIGLLSGPFYFTLFTGWDGQTPAKRLFRLRVVTISGDPIGYGRAFLRYIGYLVSFLPAGIGFLMIAMNRKKRGLHDLMAGTCVVIKVK